MSKVLKNECFSYSRRLPKHKSQERDFGQKRRCASMTLSIGKKPNKRMKGELAKMSDFQWQKQ